METLVQLNLNSRRTSLLEAFQALEVQVAQLNFDYQNELWYLNSSLDSLETQIHVVYLQIKEGGLMDLGQLEIREVQLKKLQEAILILQDALQNMKFCRYTM